MHREKETTKKKKISASVTTTDRLTNLPESIIHHILSFLDTKSSIQTSLLSRPWRSLWKQVPVLDLNRSSSPDSSSFYKFVDNVLSLRNRDLNLRKVTYMNKGYDIDTISLSELVFKYAAAHADEFSFELRYQHDYSRFLGLITTTSSCNLKTMTLRNGMINNPIEFGSSPGFQSLTSLVLDDCSLWLQHHPDPFAKFPCLKYLVLYGSCIFDSPDHNYTLKVSGLQLLTLKLNANGCKHKVEINAPKLESLALHMCSHNFPEFTGVSLQSLVHASLFCFYGELERPELPILMSLFRLIGNVKFLNINFTFMKALERESKLLQQHSSPFVKLEKLFLGSPISDQLSNYFFPASCHRICVKCNHGVF
ncbi:F-box/FBD/LRR-repeat protein At2g26030 [Linum perenne]